MHVLKEIDLCQFSKTITHNDHFFLAVLSSLLIHRNILYFQQYAPFKPTYIFSPSSITATIFILFLIIKISTKKEEQTKERLL